MLPVADVRIVTGTPATIAGAIYDQEGDPVADPGAVTVGVVNLAGGTVVNPGSSTGTLTASPALRTVELEAPDDVDLYTVTWSAGASSSRTLVEVAGRHYAGPQAIRASDPVLSDPGQYPDARLIQARRAVEDEFERVIGYALVPRVGVHEELVDQARNVTLPHQLVRTIRSVTFTPSGTSTPITVAHELDAGAGTVRIPRTGAGLVRVVYTHGLDRPTGEALDAFFTRARDVIHRDNRGLSDRLTTFTSDVGGTYSLAVAGRGGSLTGIPDVDVVLRGLSRGTPGIG